MVPFWASHIDHIQCLAEQVCAGGAEQEADSLQGDQKWLCSPWIVQNTIVRVLPGKFCSPAAASDLGVAPAAEQCCLKPRLAKP